MQLVISGAGADNRRCVMYCNGGPHSKLLHAHSQSGTNAWKQKQRQSIGTNTTASETERFSDFAFSAEPTAAMAEPPHIAVPELSK